MTSNTGRVTAIEHESRLVKSNGGSGMVSRALVAGRATVLSCDIFDTVLLRDSSTETNRLATASRRAADRLGVDRWALTRMRWLSQQSAYRAVAMERPAGDANLWAMCLASVAPFGLGSEAAMVLRDAELEVDAAHLSPNLKLLDEIALARTSGVRVIAVSDIYYSSADLTELLTRVVGRNPFDAIYASSELGATKAAGGIFSAVASIEQFTPSTVLHVGDSLTSDVVNARAAGWAAIHAPRGRAHDIRRLFGQLRSLRARRERDR